MNTVSHRTRGPKAQAQRQTTADAEVWQEGAPAHIEPAFVLVDLRIARHLKCPGCRRRRMEGHPQHTSTRYRVLCVCPACGCKEVL